VCRGKEASFAFLPAEVPTEATIVAIVDEVQERLPLPDG
jgi:microcompartment protein CcmK/EutM